MKTLGVLGGMGPAATVDFLAKLQAATPAGRDQDHIHTLVDLNPQVPDRNVDAHAAEAELARMAAGLRDAGAEVLAMPCNTAHAHAAAIEAASGLKLIDLIEVACAAAAATGARRIGLIGTGAAVDLYAAQLEVMGLTPLRLGEAGGRRFMENLYRIKAGDLGPGVSDSMAALAEDLIAAGAGAVIAACTELPLVLKTASAPLIDATQALAEACVTACCD
ncbi:aspartate racemase [Caulobacter ginsengisoli]|uniref:Aspartate racemase n=1 Tax=Caulobacter ginsengisoli TaxID=400775 RepID=A0ABU0IUV8_9CAUL|nr:amino acid racemase [Caulobacter ginsengisoli]MDQ0465801.1 aspartate racemase [Caulobacter ginsengisoli]